LLGHAGEAYTKATAMSYGWKWTEHCVVCEFCATAKSKQKAIKKINFLLREKPRKHI
jgi:hypothetical protein